MSILCAWGMSELFYDSAAYIPFLMAPTAVIAFGILRGMVEKKRMQAVMEFQELLNYVSAGLYAGLSLENSFIRGIAALKEQHLDGLILLCSLEEGVTKLRLNIPITQVLEELARQTEIEDVAHFARVTAAAQKNGGNLIQMIAQAVGHITDKLKTDLEIAAMISAKKMEQSIMCVMPFAMVLYMKLTSPQYFDALYHNAFGVIFMSLCLLVILLSYLLGRYLVDIKV